MIHIGIAVSCHLFFFFFFKQFDIFCPRLNSMDFSVWLFQRNINTISHCRCVLYIISLVINKGKRPKNMIPGENPDPNRWLPKKKKSVRKNRHGGSGVLRGTQGSADVSAEILSYVSCFCVFIRNKTISTVN